MSLVLGDVVNISLSLLSVDGEEIPEDSGERVIQRSVRLAELQSDPLSQFVSSELLSWSDTKEKVYHIPGDLFFPGFRNDLICEIPKKNMEKDIEKGELIQNKNGNTGLVLEVKEDSDSVLVDFNHPLSNKTLGVKLKLLQVLDSSKVQNSSCMN